MSEGISVDEACANNVVGTKEDFERLCNKDGTVKNQPKTTTFTLKNDNSNSITINNAHLQIAAVCILILVIVIVGLVIRSLKRRKTN